MMTLNLRSLRKLAGLRNIHTTPVSRIDATKVEEVRIPVPWGHIAGKWWGSKEKQPILAIHGWQDNAGSWDPFTSALPEEFSLLAIDLPGNGLSSHIPPFQNYYFIDSVPVMRAVKLHFGFDKLHLLGHSGGSASCFLYSAIYPEEVLSYFGVDYLAYAYKNEAKRVANLGKLIDKKLSLALRDPNKSKTYTWDEAKNIWVTATIGSIGPASAEILMKRGVHRMSDGTVLFSRDQRLKAGDMFLFNSAQSYKLVENVKCDVALVKATKSQLFESGLKNIPDILDLLKRSAKSFEFHSIDGNHHVHMDLPDVIVDLYLKFRQKIEKEALVV
ncbi:probable serine hydrolase isoform X3 [Cimex lectularius]|nr:probable serine hydrolase isoform X3 [Cimex lectularius]